MERLKIREDGAFSLPGGDLLAFMRHLESRGIRCRTTCMILGDRTDETYPQAHLLRPSDAEWVQQLYLAWTSRRV